MKNDRVAVVLFNLGGPDRPEAVKPFLFNLFNDRAIIGLPQPFRWCLAKLISWRRAKVAREIYANIGGKSPLLELTLAQAEALEKELSFQGNYRVFVSMRYWHPFSREVVAKLADFAPGQVVLLPLYGQFSTSTTESSFLDFENELKRAQKRGEIAEDLAVKKICCYFDNEEFILAHAKLIVKKIEQEGLSLERLRILFSAHGLPQKLIDGGDPYVFQVEESSKRVLAKVEELLNAKIDSKVCYQSKVGPMKWTGPSLDHEIRRVAVDEKDVLVVPIAFVSEHSETLVELDIEYKELADELGIEGYYRVPALNADGHFVAGLKGLCEGVVAKGSGVFPGGGGCRKCPQGFGRCGRCGRGS